MSRRVNQCQEKRIEGNKLMQSLMEQEQNLRSVKAEVCKMSMKFNENEGACLETSITFLGGSSFFLGDAKALRLVASGTATAGKLLKVNNIG